MYAFSEKLRKLIVSSISPKKMVTSLGRMEKGIKSPDPSVVWRNS